MLLVSVSFLTTQWDYTMLIPDGYINSIATLYTIEERMAKRYKALDPRSRVLEFDTRSAGHV